MFAPTHTFQLDDGLIAAKRPGRHNATSLAGDCRLVTHFAFVKNRTVEQAS